MIIKGSAILELDEKLGIQPTDDIEILGFEVVRGYEAAHLRHVDSGQEFYKDVYELNFLLEN